jgi:hypothetical protein
MKVERRTSVSSPDQSQSSTLFLRSEQGQEIETSLTAGSYSVILEQRGYESSPLIDFSVEDGGTTALGTVELVPHPLLRLRILQPDGTPITRSSRVRAAGDDDVPFFLWVPVLDGGLVEVRPGEDTPDTVTLVVETHPRIQASSGSNPGFQHLRAEAGSSSSGEPRTVNLAPWKRVDVEVTGLHTSGDEGIRLTSSIPEIHSSSPTTRSFRCFLARGRYTFSAESPLLSIDSAEITVGDGDSPSLVRLRVR